MERKNKENIVTTKTEAGLMKQFEDVELFDKITQEDGTILMKRKI